MLIRGDGYTVNESIRFDLFDVHSIRGGKFDLSDGLVNNMMFVLWYMR